MKWRKRAKRKDKTEPITEAQARHEIDMNSEEYNERYVSYIERRYQPYDRKNDYMAERRSRGGAMAGSRSYNRDDQPNYETRRSNGGKKRGKSHLQKTYEILNETTATMAGSDRLK